MPFGMSSNKDKRYRRARTTALVLLFFLGITALGGAVGMIVGPDGRSMKLPLDMLAKTPFDSFLVPALILGTFNGILSLVIAVLVLSQKRFQSILVMFQGAVLFIWLTAEVLMDLFYAALTIPYYLVSVLLILCGIVMRKFRTVQR